MMRRRTRILLALQKGLIETRLSKADIPEVQAAIALLSRETYRQWRRRVDEGIRDVLDALDRLPSDPAMTSVAPISRSSNEERSRRDLLVALLLLLEQRIKAPLPSDFMATVRDVSEGLLEAGAARSGLHFSPATERGARALQMASIDFSAILAGHWETVRDAVAAEIEFFLTSGAARKPATLAHRAAGAAGIEGLPMNREDWLARLRGALDAEGTGFLPFALDLWAYRWFSVGALRAAADAGLEEVQLFNNPPFGPDERTTSFCFWVHGRVVSVAKLEDRLEGFFRARLSGNELAARAAWPLLKGDQIRQQEQFALFLERAGLPPYHGHCRTYARRIRTG